MNFICNHERVVKALSIVGSAVSSRSSLPVLGNIAITAEIGKGATFEATNIDFGIRASIPATVYDGGATTLPARLLRDVIGSLPPEPLSFILSTRTQETTIQCGRSITKLKGIDRADFPALPVWGETDEQIHEIDSVSAIRLIKQVTIAAGTDDSRPTLTGVEMSAVGGMLNVAATDGFRLSLCQRSIAGDIESLIVPARYLREVERIAALIKVAHIEMSVGSKRNQIHFCMESDEITVHIFVQLIDSKFPDYRAIVPKSQTTRIVCDVAPLLRATRMVMLFARDKANITNFEIKADADSFGLFGQSDEYGDGRSEIDAQISGEPLKIAVDGTLLIDALQVISQPQLAIEMTTPNRPMVIYPIGDASFKYVLMPMQPK